ncbi:hypothetical protein H4I95_00685 [Botrytis cinerea]
MLVEDDIIKLVKTGASGVDMFLKYVSMNPLTVEFDDQKPYRGEITGYPATGLDSKAKKMAARHCLPPPMFLPFMKISRPGLKP